MDHWLVVRIRPQQYAKAELNVRNQGAEWYCPMAMIKSPRTGRATPTPLFPGYAFVRPSDDRWVFLRGTIGVLDVLMSIGDAPARMAASEVEMLRSRASADGVVHLECPARFAPGDEVMVSKGAVSLGAVVEGMSGEERVFVLMQVLGRWTRAEVGVGDISELK